jgi:hypothetical protein
MTRIASMSFRVASRRVTGAILSAVRPSSGKL